VYPESRHVLDPEIRRLQIRRLIGKVPTIAAYTYRHSLGFPYVYPDNDLSYAANFMNMLWKMVEPKYQANPVLARALDILFILHADHEQNCSTNVMRAAGSSQADPFLATAAAAAALSTVYPDARNIHDPEVRALQIRRLIGKVPTIAAYTYRHSLGFPYVYPDNDLSYAENFMNMLWKMVEPKYQANPVLARALDILFILHADHEQNCSTNVMRAVGSSHADPFVATAAAAAALSGPLHGGANEEVLKMLDEIGSKDRVPAYVESVKAGKGKLMGFGHRVYKNYDPRARIIKWAASEVFEVTGKNPKLEIALELERIALEDDYFVKRKLYPNVDFYSGIMYQAMGFHPDMFTVLFAIPRTVGWLAQWQEMIEDPEQKIARPRQIYTGSEARNFVPVDKRATPVKA